MLLELPGTAVSQHLDRRTTCWSERRRGQKNPAHPHSVGTCRAGVDVRASLPCYGRDQLCIVFSCRYRRRRRPHPGEGPPSPPKSHAPLCTAGRDFGTTEDRTFGPCCQGGMDGPKVPPPSDSLRPPGRRLVDVCKRMEVGVIDKAQLGCDRRRLRWRGRQPWAYLNPSGRAATPAGRSPSSPRRRVGSRTASADARPSWARARRRDGSSAKRWPQPGPRSCARVGAGRGPSDTGHGRTMPRGRAAGAMCSAAAVRPPDR